MRIRVIDVLEWLSADESTPSILSYHPNLEEEDIRACLAYAARELDR
jgi:uncharacterized protein (DUF433 family)